MHKRDDGTLRYSPSDLTRFMGSRFSSWVARYNLEHPDRAIEQDPPDEATALLQQRGLAHEADFVHVLQNEGRSVHVVPDKGYSSDERLRETLNAMQEGREVIVQAALTHQVFLGYADFLMRTDQPSELGAWSYEPWDTKLALSFKPYFAVQLCCYAEMLEAIQGRRPEHLGVILGNNEKVRYRSADFYFAYIALKQEFLQQMSADFSVEAQAPFPKTAAEHRPYAQAATAKVQEADHLSLVAGMTSSQIAKLNRAGINTLADLATTATPSVKRLSPGTYARLKRQAQLQQQSRSRDTPLFDVLQPESEQVAQGLARMPPPREGDIFFDMEGYPHAPGGLEYLFGATFDDGQGPEFKAFWAHSKDEEKRALESFIDWSSERRKRYPAMHIYHYAPYEKTALRRLVSEHATRERELDAFLRDGVLVDLYRVVREGLMVGEPAYSIKNLEHLYWPDKPRYGDVTDAGASIVAYHQWIVSGEPACIERSPRLRAIYDYNKDDCDSTLALCLWLREQARAHGISYAAPETEVASVDDAASAEADRTELRPQQALRRQMLKQVPPAIPEADTERWRVHTLLAELLEYYWREQKPLWWRMYAWMDSSHEELFDDPDALASLQRTAEPPVADKRSYIFSYRFDPEQETKLYAGANVRLLGFPDVRGRIAELDRVEGTVGLKLSRRALSTLADSKPPSLLSLFPHETPLSGALETALFELVERFAHGEGLPPALEQLLFRTSPFTGERGDNVPQTAERHPWLARVVTDGSATLCIQGPPGAGKTWTGARLITELLRQGKRVGITSNSHKAIVNLMAACCSASEDEGLSLSPVKVAGPAPSSPTAQRYGIEHIQTKDIPDQWAKPKLLLGGTAWTFARPELRQQVDVLVVDEAGQFALAHLVAVSASCKSLVLLGDQQQLAQPVQGAHPGETGLSCLEYLLQDNATIPPELGVFLATTWRMTPALTAFISESFYDGRLQSEALTHARKLVLPDAPRGRLRKTAGIQYVAVPHQGNTYASDEEVEVVVSLVEELVAMGFVATERSSHGTPRALPERRLQHEDILVVTPYNVQVRRLRAALPDTVRIGTVDKFQGQEAPVVIVSMASSDASESSRGLSFLFDPNRLNVALSRAQCLAVVVASPTLAKVQCRTVKQLRLSNLFCRIAHDEE